jgi:nucleotide-binding universal stress UspA family protein
MEAEVFRRILVAIDGSDAARSAFVFVSDWARQFDAQVWFIQLAEESSTRRCSLVTDVSARGRQLSNRFSVSGVTRRARNQQLVSAITEAAEIFHADLVVLGFDRRRIAHDRFTRSVREQLTEATSIPVMMAPRTIVSVEEGEPPPARQAIPLGRASGDTEMTRLRQRTRV